MLYVPPSPRETGPWSLSDIFPGISFLMTELGPSAINRIIALRYHRAASSLLDYPRGLDKKCSCSMAILVTTALYYNSTTWMIYSWSNHDHSSKNLTLAYDPPYVMKAMLRQKCPRPFMLALRNARSLCWTLVAYGSCLVIMVLDDE